MTDEDHPVTSPIIPSEPDPESVPPQTEPIFPPSHDPDPDMPNHVHIRGLPPDPTERRRIQEK
jgi:hypothetical protein